MPTRHITFTHNLYFTLMLFLDLDNELVFIYTLNLIISSFPQGFRLAFDFILLFKIEDYF